MFVEDPQYKTVNFYDSEMKRVQKESLDLYISKNYSLDKEVKQEQKQDVPKDTNQKVSKELNKPKQNKSRSNRKAASL